MASPVMAAETETSTPQRVLHFPKDRALGRIMVQDAGGKEKLDDFQSWYGQPDYQEAKGDVTVPAGQIVGPLSI